MSRLNRDTVVALALLVGCGAFWVESFSIRETSYGQIQSWVWPQVILAVLTVMGLVLLGQSVLQPAMEPEAEAAASAKPGLLGWLDRYRNALICYALFLAFLLSLPVLGMLIGGALFVFATLSALGAPSLRLVPFHLAIAVGSVGVMWAIFTFGLRVFLPEGMILSF